MLTLRSVTVSLGGTRCIGGKISWRSSLEPALTPPAPPTTSSSTTDALTWRPQGFPLPKLNFLFTLSHHPLSSSLATHSSHPARSAPAGHSFGSSSRSGSNASSALSSAGRRSGRASRLNSSDTGTRRGGAGAWGGSWSGRRGRWASSESGVSGGGGESEPEAKEGAVAEPAKEVGLEADPEPEALGIGLRGRPEGSVGYVGEVVPLCCCRVRRPGAMSRSTSRTTLPHPWLVAAVEPAID